MTHLPDLIQDLGFILITAAVVTLVFKRLKQPVVLGYLIAGFLIGPNFVFFPNVKDPANILIWAEIGVIFMLFGLGLEFSFKKLMAVGKSASITAVFEIAAMLGIGYLAGQFLNWSSMDSLFLGGILAISSTTIIVRAFEELGLKGRSFVSLVFGVLIVEDLIAILLLVLLSSVAASESLSSIQLAVSSLWLGFFLVLWFLLGIYLLPMFFRRCRDLLTNETTLIVSIGLCLLMVILATQVGFSPALGAFVMGSILAETREGRRIEHLILPVKDLFSAVFFVSVGMMIDPKILEDYFGVICFLTALTIFAKFLSSSMGALISGQNLKTSVQTGMSLAQIGEFSFIIATLGMSLKVTSDFLYPVAVAVSALTTFATPYLMKHSGRFSTWLENQLPQELQQTLSRYQAAMSSGSYESATTLLWKEYGIKMALNSVIVIAITLLADFGLRSWTSLSSSEVSQEWIYAIACTITLVVAAPFLWAIVAGGPSHRSIYPPETLKRLERLQIGVSIVRFILGCILIGVVVSHFTSILAFTGLLFLILAAMGLFFFSRYSGPIYRKIERRFIANLTENERSDLDRKVQNPDLAPWNATLTEFVLTPHSPLIAKPLGESRLKEDFSVTVAMIDRGGKRMLPPNRMELLLPYDKLFLIGTDEQLALARSVIEVNQGPTTEFNAAGSFGLSSILLESTDRFVEKTIRECGLRETGLIVGIERSGERILSPNASMKLKAGDLLWIVGDRARIKEIKKVTP